MKRPLFWNELIEARERTRFVHVLNNWISRFFPNLAILARRPGRRSVESQLLQRPHFATEAWREYGLLPQVIAVLKLLQWELGLPNCNFLPDDSLSLLMDSCYGIDDVFVLQEIETRYAVKYRKEDLQRIRDERWTVANLVTDLLERAQAQAEKRPERRNEEVKRQA